MSDTASPANIAISCSSTVKDILCEALKNSACGVLPDRDAGQYGATRSQLLTVIHTIEHTYTDAGDVLQGMPTCDNQLDSALQRDQLL